MSVGSSFRSRLPLAGNRDASLGRSPFGPTAPTITAAVAYAAAGVVWVLVGAPLPGGRWLAVHLFTLGVLTNLVLVFSEHFGRTLTRQPDQSTRWQPVVANVGIVLVLVGLPTATRWAVSAGATIVTAVVVASYVRLRRMRRAAVGARFVWIVRMYERAHGAFVHGAILGLLMGTGLLAGGWYGSARLAHLHVNILGWGGLTLLATIVFFGPTLVRTRIVAGADDRAARVLRHGATGLTLGVFALLATGVGGSAAVVARLVAAAGLAVFAVGCVVTCAPVARAAHGAKPSAPRWPVVALAVWFPLLVIADVVVVATGSWRYLDALGLGMILGVLGQAMLAVLSYLSPMLRQRSFVGRDRLMARLERGATLRALAWNLATVAIVTAATTTAGWAALLARTGWVAAAIVLAWTGAAVLLPTPTDDGGEAASAVARRYRPDQDTDR